MAYCRENKHSSANVWRNVVHHTVILRSALSNNHAIPSSVSGDSRLRLQPAIPRSIVRQVAMCQGVVIGTIDAGVRATHSLLASKIRPDYNWFDTLYSLAAAAHDHRQGANHNPVGHDDQSVDIN
ncbi:hypothetical protein AC1031_017428 [Aphanomyces cochlioides]|nr:hypothetical protein AC1031_017428 [Aphanomyces cochlioides]